MKKVLIYVTVIFALFALPITTIYWWPAFWGPQADYWYPWIPKLAIAAAVIAGLWLIEVIRWLRERKAGIRLYGGIPYHQATGQHSTSDEQSSEPDWIVDERGQARRPHDKPQYHDIVSDFGQGDLLSQIQRDTRRIRRIIKRLDKELGK